MVLPLRCAAEANYGLNPTLYSDMTSNSGPFGGVSPGNPARRHVVRFREDVEIISTFSKDEYRRGSIKRGPAYVDPEVALKNLIACLDDARRRAANRGLVAEGPPSVA